MRVMITGASGFIGGYLAAYCREAGCTVLGLGVPEPENLDAWAGGDVSFETCDVRDAARLGRLLADFQPERIFHLAAQSYPTVSLIEPIETMETNVCGTVNLFEGMRASGVEATVVVACSSAEYGPVASTEVPVKETHALRPVHPYGVSKVAQDMLAAQYFGNYGIRSIRIRIFNTTGPGKQGDVCSDLTKRAVEMELGIQPPRLRVGDTSKLRAIADVGDLVKALWAAERCAPGDVYNVGGERVYSVTDVIDIIRGHIAVDFALERDPALMRPTDEPIIAGDISKFRECTGWKPEIELTQTVPEMLDWWRERLAPGWDSGSAAGLGLQTARS